MQHGKGTSMIVEKEQNDTKRVLVSIIVIAAKQSASQIGVVLKDLIVTIQDRDPQMGIRLEQDSTILSSYC